MTTTKGGTTSKGTTAEGTTPLTGSSPAGASRRPRTRQREAIAQSMAATEGFVSAQQLHAQLREGGERIGLATVYRGLQSMADEGELDVVRSDDGEALYRRCSTGHHHHLTCRDCRRTVEVDSAAVERWAREVGAANGFTQVEHLIEVFGTCSDCAATTR